MSKPETPPCLPECRKVTDDLLEAEVFHAPNCPKVEAPPKRKVMIVEGPTSTRSLIESVLRSEPVLLTIEAPPAPKCEHNWGPAYIPDGPEICVKCEILKPAQPDQKPETITRCEGWGTAPPSPKRVTMAEARETLMGQLARTDANLRAEFEAEMAPPAPQVKLCSCSESRRGLPCDCPPAPVSEPPACTDGTCTHMEHLMNLPAFVYDPKMPPGEAVLTDGKNIVRITNVSQPHKCENPSECYDCLRLPVSEPPILEKIKAATQRILDNHAPMRIPADPRSDVDIVLGDCANEILALKAQNAALSAEVERLKAEPNRQTILRQAAELERLRKARTGSAVERLRNLCDGFEEMDKEQEAKVATLTAEVERLRDLIARDHGPEELPTEDCCGRGLLHSEAMAILRAAREAGKS